MKTEEIIASIRMKDAALRNARHLLKKWEEGFDMDDFYHDAEMGLLDIKEALGEKEE
tara:strand:+ start:332 stop:502 length:171 start_codon:yes stop_codon:yes gene_type:complete